MRPFDVVRQRLLAQQVWGAGAGDAGAAVRRLLAVQAQEYAYARWSVAQRCAGNGRDSATAVDHALADGTLLRTHVLRPTWHLVHRDDARWLLELSGPRVRAAMKSRDRELGIDGALLGRAKDAFADALASGTHLDRQELGAALERAGVLVRTGEKLRGSPVHGQLLGHLVLNAELDMLLVSGAPRTTTGGSVRPTYALFEDRVPPAAPVERDAALARLVLRYFSGHGPATVKDCSLWSGLTMADIRRGLAGTPAGALERREFDGHEFFLAVPDGSHAPRLPRVDLLQCYDEMVMGYTPTRGYLFNRREGAGLRLGNANLSLHPLLIDGFQAGLWRHVLGPEAATVEARPDHALDGGERRALAAAVERYGRFLHRPLELRLQDHGP
ncbi:winged helix DNA-binding domain-containing protein [Arthrobacter sp. I2-34]|uniref:Winged helix DNA-binding domain-containing protein n=1 Tax=Arthrobacter hankyongi TaxID=2904801 RepID=A0ABS9L1Q7_9MICC|nr:winged helix DNA-binding domain-containing protein [Arthrobacter hankyongi]MCG2620437.1 winged helix DNA-binding domain-containing protein [Arthrobacter hankyongi]